MNRRVLLLAPLGVAAAGGAAFMAMLNRMQAGRFDPRAVGDVQTGKRVPAFALPGSGGGEGFSDADIAAAGKPIMVNFFASWCVPCIEEHPVLMDLWHSGIPVWGIAYKDKPEASAAFIRRHGNPYARVAADLPGTVAIDFGVFGVPETFLVDRTGVIRWHLAGPLSPDRVEGEIKPMLRRYA